MDTKDDHLLSSGIPYVFRIQDFNQQVLALKNNTLIATPHSDHVTPVFLESMPCRDKEYLVTDKGTAIYLGIQNKELCLFCEESGGQPILKMQGNNVMALYSSVKAQKPFVFYQNQANNTSTFESAACPGWFICTSNEKDRPVTMTQNRGTNHSYQLSPQSGDPSSSSDDAMI